MAHENKVLIDGVVSKQPYVMEKVAFVALRHTSQDRGQDFTSYIDVCCFGEQIKAAAALVEGDVVRVRARVGTRKDKDSGKYGLQLVMTGCETLVKAPRGGGGQSSRTTDESEEIPF